MKSVLLVSANQEKNPYPVAPLGLLYIAHALRHNGFKVSLLDLCFSKNITRDIKASIKCFKPNFVGVSIRNIDNLSFPRSISYLPAIKNVIRCVKFSTDAPVILGGSAFSLFPEGILRFTGCNMGIVGEGEDAFVFLLKKIINSKTNLSSIPNLSWISKNKFSQNQLCCDASVDFIVTRDLINNRLYNKFGGMGNIQTKRGCRFRCTYCTYPSLEGRVYKLRSPELIAKEVEFLKKRYMINHVFFVDSVFNYPLEHASAICKAIIKKRVLVTWSCFAWPHRMNQRILALMKQAGCTHIEFGSDSLSEDTLKRLRKPFSVKDIMHASALCKKAGIKFCHYVIFGSPGENNKTLNESFKNIKRLKSTAVIAMVGVRIYPGTELQQLSIKENIIREDNDLLQPNFYFSPAIEKRDLLEKVSGFAKDNSNFIVPGMGIMSSDKIHETLRRHYKEGPLWGYLEN